jgi:hypothetical protein
MSQDAPSNAGELVGERNGEDVVMQPLLGRLEPRLEPVTIPAPGFDQYNATLIVAGIATLIVAASIAIPYWAAQRMCARKAQRLAAARQD